jgi:hypothetical protein
MYKSEDECSATYFRLYPRLINHYDNGLRPLFPNQQQSQDTDMYRMPVCDSALTPNDPSKGVSSAFDSRTASWLCRESRRLFRPSERLRGGRISNYDRSSCSVPSCLLWRPQMRLPLEDKGIESIPLKSGEGLGLRSEHSSRFLCFTRVDSFAK